MEKNEQTLVNVFDIFLQGMMAYAWAAGHNQEQFDEYSTEAVKDLKKRADELEATLTEASEQTRIVTETYDAD